MAPKLPAFMKVAITEVGQFFMLLWAYFFEEEIAVHGALPVVITSLVLSAFSFHLSCNLPQGVYQRTVLSGNNEILHEIGKSVAAYYSPYEYTKLYEANTLLYVCCISMLLLFAIRVSLRSGVFSFFVLIVGLGTVITTATLAYKSAMLIITPSEYNHPIINGLLDYVDYVLNSSLRTWFLSLVITMLVFIYKHLQPFGV